MSAYSKPLPAVTDETRPYWEACKKHELRIQQCKKCGRFRHYPQEMCPSCHSLEFEWAQVSGRGKVYNLVVTHQAFHPGFRDEVPYATVIIELDEGVRMVSRMADTKPEELEIGMPVEVAFEDVTDEITLPMFKRLQKVKR